MEELPIVPFRLLEGPDDWDSCAGRPRWSFNLLITTNDFFPCSQEELDCYPLECIHQCSAVLDSCIYNSILAIGVKENSPRQTSIILFQCEQIGVSDFQNQSRGGAQKPCERLFILVHIAISIATEIDMRVSALFPCSQIYVLYRALL